MSTYNILSIDGGGLRGIAPIRILQMIEQRRGKSIQEIFHLISGTSTGGLLAACLTIRDEKNPDKPKFSLDKIAEIFINKGKIIFPIKSGIAKFFGEATNLWQAAYSPDGLDCILKEYAEGARIKNSLLPILVSTYDLNTNAPVFFKTSEAHDNPSANAYLTDICRATSAAPTYLPSYSFQYKNTLLTGIDGGVFVNNPTMAAIAEISKFGHDGFYKKRDGSAVEFEDIRALSLGTGQYNGPVSTHKAVNWGQMKWVTRIVDIMMTGVSQTTNYESNEMLDKGKYLRLTFDIKDKERSDMADARDETRLYIEQAVKDQVTNNTVQLGLLDAFLNNLN